MVSFRPGNKGQPEQNDEEFLKIIPERFRVDNSDDDDYEEDRPSLIKRIIPKLLGLVVVIALVGGGFFAWQMFKKGGEVKPDAQLPVVKAEAQNYKAKPQQPGGMDVPNQDKMIYDRIGAKPEAAQAPVEKLLPAPEAPKEQAKPQALTKTEPPAPQTAPQALVNQTTLPAAALAPPPAIVPPPPQIVPQPQPQIAAVTPAPAPVVVQTPAKPAQAPTIASSASGNFMVQIASVSTQEAAEEEWRKKSAAHKDLLGNFTHDVQKADLGDKGVRYRLRFGPFADRPQAVAACEELKTRKIDCIVAAK